MWRLRVWSVLLVLLLAAPGLWAQAQADDVTITLPEVDVPIGTTAEVEVLVDCPDASCNIFRGSIGFDPTIINVVEIRPGAYIGEEITLLESLNVIDNQFGTVEFFLSNTRRATDTTEGVLMILVVSGIEEGFSPLIFTPDPVPLVVKAGSRDLVAAVVDGSIDVTPPPTPTPELPHVTLRRDNTLFALPDVDAQELEPVLEGETLDVLGANRDFSWLFVRTRDGAAVGWLRVNLLVTLDGDVDAIPTLSDDEAAAIIREALGLPEASPTPTATFTPEPTTTPTDVPTDAPSPTPQAPVTLASDTPAVPPTITLAPTNTQAPTITLAPSNTPPPTITLPPTNTLPPTITLPPTVTPTSEATSTPAETPTPTSTPSNTPTPTPVIEPIFIVDRTESQQVNARGGPGRGFNVVALVPRGEVLDIIGQSGSGDDLWFEVRLPGGETGFIAAILGTTSVRVDGEIQTPTPTPTPEAGGALVTNCERWARGAPLRIVTPPGVIDVFLRASPRPSETRWVVLGNQTPVVIIGGPSGTQCWWQVRTEGRPGGEASGWVEQGFLALR